MKLSLTKILLLGLLLRILLMFLVWHPDLNNHIDWGIRFFEYGPEKFYAPSSNVWNFTWPNQPPGTILIFAGIRKLYEFLFSIVWWINVNIPLFPSNVMKFFEEQFYQGLLKLPAILADLGIAYIIYKFFVSIKKSKLAVLGAAFFLFNPVVWYNSAVWGQTDSTINFFAILSLYMLLRKKLIWSAIFLSICLYIKISLAIFVPLFVIIAIRQKYKVRQYLFSIILPLFSILAVTLIFSGNQNPAVWLYEIYTKKVLTNQLQVITANAFNIWASIAGIHERPQSLPFLLLTYRDWGYILFGLSFIPLLVALWKSQKPTTVIWVFALTAFSSWMFLTNMHERYLYPLFPYFTILAVNYKKLRPIYWSVSGINLLNLYNFWFVPRIEPIVSFMSFGDRLMPRLFGIINTGLLAVVYSRFYKHKKLVTKS